MKFRNSWNIRTNFAVAEIVGTIIMLGISTSAISVIYYQVESAPVPIPAPIVEISGKIDNNNVVVTHRGGEPLDLDTELVLNIGGIYKNFKVKDGLDSKSKEDGVWNLGEKFVYPLEYDFDYSLYPNLDIKVVDQASNSLIMTGITKAFPTCDMSVTVTVNNLKPKEFDFVEFTITVINNANINASGVKVELLIDEGLTYYNSIMDSGSYDIENNTWDIGRVQKGETLVLILTMIVGDVIYSDTTQFAILIDGSGSIKHENWIMMLNGIIAAVKDDSRFSHNGNIELTIIQFGGKSPAFARLEIGPIVVTKSNIDSILEDISNIEQIGDWTPTSCAVIMAADLLAASSFFNPDIRQVILLVTDGNPTHTCDCEYDSYPDIPTDLSKDNDDFIYEVVTSTVGPKDAVTLARNYTVDLLNLDPFQDEFNVLAVELYGVEHNTFIKDNVVWPTPGYYMPDEYTEDTETGGWTRNVSSWEEFADSINESFELMFNKIPITVMIGSSAFSDPKAVNDESRLVLKPIPVFSSATSE